MICYKNHFKDIKNNKKNFTISKIYSSRSIAFFQDLYVSTCSQYFTKYIIRKKSLFQIQYNLKKDRGLAEKVKTLELEILNRPNKKREKKRSSLILPQHIGRVFLVHNGKSFSSIHVHRKMLGHKFGAFASTRKKPVHKKKR